MIRELGLFSGFAGLGNRNETGYRLIHKAEQAAAGSKVVNPLSLYKSFLIFEGANRGGGIRSQEHLRKDEWDIELTHLFRQSHLLEKGLDARISRARFLASAGPSWRFLTILRTLGGRASR